MSKVTLIGIGLPKRVLHLYGAPSVGSFAYPKKLSR